MTVVNMPDRAPDSRRPALLIAAHGDRGVSSDHKSNRHVKAHVATLQRDHRFACVSCGFLKGEPLVEDALRTLQGDGVDDILIYPLFMSDGYFTNTALPERISKAAIAAPIRLLTPLGRDPRLAVLCERQASKLADETGQKMDACKLLIVGHGSTQSAASKTATESFAARVSAISIFDKVETAFLEEPPFLQEALLTTVQPIIISGFFAGEGLHGGEDVPDLINQTGANARYMGALGALADIPALIEQAASLPRVRIR